MRGSEPLGRQYQYFIVHYCYTRVLLHLKMLKETETEETIGFNVTFLSLVAFPLGGQAPWALPGYAYGADSICCLIYRMLHNC